MAHIIVNEKKKRKSTAQIYKNLMVKNLKVFGALENLIHKSRKELVSGNPHFTCPS